MNAHVFPIHPGKQVTQGCQREITRKKKKKEQKNLSERMIKPSLSTVYNQVSVLSTNIIVSSCRQLFSIGTVTSFFSPSVRICGEANLS